MYRILIADDEEIERFAFRAIVNQNFDCFDPILEASSGDEAVQIAETDFPDIIIMDIKMPILDGVSAAKKIRERNKNQHIIMLTAYDNFSYIQDLIKVGIDDYLLKPTHTEKIVEVIKNAISKIEAEKRQSVLVNDISEKIDIIKPYVKSQLVISLILGTQKDFVQAKEFLEFLNITVSCGFVMLLCLKRDKSDVCFAENQFGSKELFDFIEEVTQHNKSCLLAMPFSEIVVLVYFSKERMEKYKLKLMAISLAQDISRNFAAKKHKQTIIGIGDAFNDISEIETSYTQAMRAIESSSDIDIRHYGDLSLADSKSEIPAQKEKEFLNRLKIGNLSDCNKALDEIFAWLFSTYKNDLSMLRIYISSLIPLSLRAVFGMHEINESTRDFYFRDYFSEINNISDLWNLKKWFENLIEDWLKIRYQIYSDKVSDVITDAVEYINNNYMNDISLELCSEQFLLSPPYFSRLFKQVTGSKFIDYLTNTRITQAKLLLETQAELSTKQVGSLVGYQNTNYFFKVFKKATNLTPLEYRRNIQL